MLKKTTYSILTCVLAVVVLPVAGYLISYALALVFPFGDQATAVQVIMVTLMTLGLLAVPYWMLWLAAHTSHKYNPEEKELQLKDLPKDKEPLQYDHKGSNLRHSPR